MESEELQPLEESNWQARAAGVWDRIRFKVQEEAHYDHVTPDSFRYASVNVYQDMEEHLDTVYDTKKEFFDGRRPWTAKIIQIIKMNETWFFLMTLGLSSAFVGLTCDTIVNYLLELRLYLWSISGAFGGFIVWVTIGVLLPMLASVCAQEISPHSAGPGLDAMKSLSGLILHQYLSLRCLVAKLFGTVLALAGGLPVGKEGPYVHISAMLAYQLAKLPIFSKIRKNDGLKIQMLAAGCAAGVAVSIGAPVGGVLFSIETTSTYYLINNLWKAFFCAVSGSLLIKVLAGNGFIALFSTHFDSSPYSTIELVSFCVMAAGFLKFVSFSLNIRRRYKILSEHRYGQITAILSYLLPPLREGQTATVNALFQPKTSEFLALGWGRPNLYSNLIAFAIGQFVLTGLCIGLPISAGLYTPVFVVGAAGGRLIGEIAALIFPDLNINPGGYAVVGAAAFGAGCTRTISSAILVFELTGQLAHLLPVLMAVILSAAVANFFVPPVYEMLLQAKGLPYMPTIRHDKALKARAYTLMRTTLVTVPLSASALDLDAILKTSSYSVYPIVDNRESAVRQAAKAPNFVAQLLQIDPAPNRSTSQVSPGRAIRRNSIDSAPIETHLEIEPIIEADVISEVKAEDAGEFGRNRRESRSRSSRDYPVNEGISVVAGFEPSPFSVLEAAPLTRVHFMFAAMGLTHAWVLQRGLLRGVVTKKDLVRVASGN